MITKSAISLLVMSTIAGAGAYYATLTASQRGIQQRECQGNAVSGVCRWLALSPEQQRIIREADPSYDTERGTLMSEIQKTAADLASALANDHSSDQEVLDKLEKGIAAHDRLERRVTEHLLKVRQHLSPDQRKQLFDVCAEHVRESRGRGRGPAGKGGGPPWMRDR